MAYQALPIDGPVQTHPSRGMLRVVPEAQLQASEQIQEQRAKDAKQATDTAYSELAGYILTQYEIMSNHRNGAGGGGASGCFGYENFQWPVRFQQAGGNQEIRGI